MMKGLRVPLALAAAGYLFSTPADADSGKVA
jgi:hypothetical protein